MDREPVFHLATADRWINDPCGLIYLGGRWHAYTQTNPCGTDWGNMSWGHATSTDLVHWDDHGIALECTEDLDIFTGSTLVDAANLTGFGTAEDPPLLAYWTGHHRPASPEAPREDQRLSVSLDGGTTFTTPQAVNPVLTRHSTDFRDPAVFARNLDGRADFVMVTVEANDRQVLIYTSTNLLDWQLASTFGPLPTPVGIWECPSLLRFDGGEQDVWMLTISAFGDDTHLPGTHYWLGAFDQTTFTPYDPTPRPLDLGPDLYATTTFAAAPLERRIALGWLSNPIYAGSTPLLGHGGAGGRGCLSLPREFEVVRRPDDRATAGRSRPDNCQWTLTQRVPDEVRRCLGPEQGVEPAPAEGKRAGVEQPGVERSGAAGWVDLDVMEPVGLVIVTWVDPVAQLDLNGIVLSRDHATLSIERPGVPGLGERYPVRTQVGLEPGTGPVSLELWVDRASLEIVTADGRTWTSTLFPETRRAWRSKGGVRLRYQPMR